jgi:hypothetical protein
MLIFGFFNLIVWLLFAPQYRFIMPVLVFFLSLLIYHLLNKKININKNLVTNFLIGIYSIMLFVSIFGINISFGSTSKEIGQIDKLNFARLVFPSNQYHFEDIDSILVNNNYYYHPSKNRYCWNADLPCMSFGYEKVISDNFQKKISQRTNTLKDGFCLINK